MALFRAIHPPLNKKLGEVWSTSSKVIGANVYPPLVNTACSVYVNAVDFGFATREISKSGKMPCLALIIFC